MCDRCIDSELVLVESVDAFIARERAEGYERLDSRWEALNRLVQSFRPVIAPAEQKFQILNETLAAFDMLWPEEDSE